MVEQPVEQGGGDDRVAQQFAPFGKATVAGQDHGALFIAGIDQLEEQVGAAGGNRQIADLVPSQPCSRMACRARDDQESRAAVEADLLDQAAFAFGPGQGFDQLGERAAIDAFAGLDRGD
jgi:hypothetical protein